MWCANKWKHKGHKAECAQIEVNGLLARLVVRWPAHRQLRPVGVIGGREGSPGARHPPCQLRLGRVELDALEGRACEYQCGDEK